MLIIPPAAWRALTIHNVAANARTVRIRTVKATNEVLREKKSMNKKKISLLLLLAALVVAYFAFDLGRFLSLNYLKSSQAAFEDLYARQPMLIVAAYFAIYVLVTALSFPGAVILTLAGGAIFGVWWGTLIVSFASSVGACLAFLASRFVLRDSVEARFGQRLAEFNRGVEKEGAFYLFTLRLVPLVPFFVINLLMGLT